MSKLTLVANNSAQEVIELSVRDCRACRKTAVVNIGSVSIPRFAGSNLQAMKAHLMTSFSMRGRHHRLTEIVKILACFFILLIASGVSAEGGLLSSQPPISLFDELGDFAQSATIADVNNDGESDILVANFGSDNVSVLLSDGAGGFTPTEVSPHQTGEGPGSIVTADFNGDGNLDLATANSGSNDISILLGDGAGAFLESDFSPVMAGNRPDSVISTDVDGDGASDLVVANGSSDDVSVLLGDGSGAFAEAGGSPIAIGGGASQALAADVNGDKNIDLVVANRDDDNVSILLGDGSGGFVAAASSPIAVGNSPEDLSLVDLNNDGELDVATANANSDDISVLLGDGSAGFSESPGSPFPVAADAGSTRSIDFGDFDEDGNIDLIASSSRDGQVSILQGDGTGGFAAAAESPYTVFTSPQSLNVGNLDSDGLVDVLVVHNTRLSILSGNGDGGLSESPRSPILFGSNPREAEIADFDEDGKNDLAILRSSQNEALVLKGTGSGQFSTLGVFPLDGNTPPVALLADDLDADGNADLVTVHGGSPGEISVLLGNGEGGFTSADNSPFLVGVFPGAVTSGDANLDGNTDLFIANGFLADNIIVLLGDGAGDFVPAANSPFPAGDRPWSVAATHVDGDNQLDLVVANRQSSDVVLLLGDGTGDFSEGETSPISVGDSPSAVEAADLNADGAVDLVVANEGSDNLSILLGDGLGGFSETTTSPIAVGAGPVALALSDFNADGNLDVSVASVDSAELIILLGDGTGDFSGAAENTFELEPGSRTLSVGDIDGDTRPDAIVVSDGPSSFDEVLSVLTSDVMFQSDFEQSSISN